MPFREAWLLFGGALVIAGLAAAEPIVVAVGLGVVAIGGAARLWSQHLFDGVTFVTSFSAERVFVGEEFKLRVSVENRKLLPLPWFRWRLGIVEALEVEEESLVAAASPGLKWLPKRGALGWYERQEWEFRLRPLERGYHQVGPATIYSADLFGLLPREAEVEQRRHITVYPEAPRLASIAAPAARPLGAQKGRNRLFEDPVRIAGLRAYRPGDPLKRIDWKASARLGDLQARVYEASAEPQLYVVLNIDTLEHSWEGYLKEDLERSISVAAAVAIWGAEQRFAVGLLANGSFPGADRPIRLAPSRSPDQVSRVLEALAVIQPLTLGDLAATVRRESTRVPAGSTIVIVASLIPESLAGAIMRLRSERHEVLVLATSDRVDTSLLGETPVLAVGGRPFQRERG